MKKLTISFENFKGSLELLYHLVQKKELAIREISLIHLIGQFTHFWQNHSISLDLGAEFMGMTSSLIWLKSCSLLPKPNQGLEEQEDPEEFQTNWIQHLIDYSQFKLAAKILSEKEERSLESFQRGSLLDPMQKKPLGIDHLTLDDLAFLFQEVLNKASSRKGFIQDEEWKVADKMSDLREKLLELETLPFYAFFHSILTKEELIVCFLAVLELMKMGEIQVVKKQNEILIVKAHG